jgi:hypothetical protein
MDVVTARYRSWSGFVEQSLFITFLLNARLSPREIALRPSCLAFLAQRVYSKNG